MTCKISTHSAIHKVLQKTGKNQSISNQIKVYQSESNLIKGPPDFVDTEPKEFKRLPNEPICHSLFVISRIPAYSSLCGGYSHSPT